MSDALRRRELARRAASDQRSAEAPEFAATIRARRIDRIEAGKSQFWRINLRVTELVNFLVFVPSITFMWWQSWAFWALVPACAVSVGGMWAFARRMRPREARLCRHMVFLARHRRRCAMCRYCIQGLGGPCCPECGFKFDSADDRHLLIPLINQMYSRQGRHVAAVAIIAGMSSVVLLAQSAEWFWYIAWSGALLVSLNGLFAYWVLRARIQQSAFERAGIRPFSDRPDPRRPADWRLLRIQYGGVLIRWAMLTMICGGLAAIVNLDASILRFASFGRGLPGLVISLGVPVLVYVLGVSLVTRMLVSRLAKRLRILLADVG